MKWLQGRYYGQSVVRRPLSEGPNFYLPAVPLLTEQERIVKIQITLKQYRTVILVICAQTNDEVIVLKDEHHERLKETLESINDRKEVILLEYF